MPNGNWVIGEMAASTPKDFHWAMMAQPKFSADQKTYVYTYTEQIWIPKDAANIDLAKQFIKFMYSDKVVELMLANKSVNKETKEETPAPIISPERVLLISLRRDLLRILTHLQVQVAQRLLQVYGLQQSQSMVLI